MNHRKLGKSEIEASVIGLGTWAIGGWMWGGTDKNEPIRAIQAAIDAGITLIDTAPAYGLGLSEEIVGEAIAGQRDKVILATKCGLVWDTDKGEYFIDQGDKKIHRHLGPSSIRYEVEESLRRLQTDYIDLYQTHWQDPQTPIEETMTTLLALKKEGKIRAIGVSNVDLDQLKVYESVGPVDSAQEKFNMLDREIETSLVPYCMDNEISVLSYSSLALGILSGKIGPDREFTGDDLRKSDPRFEEENRRKVLKMLAEFKPIAEKYGITIAQLVIAWTIAQPGITYALCGARNPQQAIENAQAGRITLTTEELDKMDKVIHHHTLHIT